MQHWRRWAQMKDELFMPALSPPCTALHTGPQALWAEISHGPTVRERDGRYRGMQGQASAPGTPSSCSSYPQTGGFSWESLLPPPPVLLSRSLWDCGPGRWAVIRALHTEARSAYRAPISACEILIPRKVWAGWVPSGAARENQCRSLPASGGSQLALVP